MESNEIKLLRNQSGKLSDKQLIEKLYDYLQGEGQEMVSSHHKIKLTSKKAFSIIYFLQEHLPLLPDHFERCNDCGCIYDSWSEGNYSEGTGKCQCGNCYSSSF